MIDQISKDIFERGPEIEKALERRATRYFCAMSVGIEAGIRQILRKIIAEPHVVLFFGFERSNSVAT